MRRFIQLAENLARPSLNDITAEMIVNAIPQADEDIQKNSWLGRAYYQDQRGPNQELINQLEKEIEEIRADLWKWSENPTLLFRGLRQKPQAERLGVHWSDYRYTALSHGHHILKAEVRPNQIDWLGTMMRRLTWSKEREFTVLPNIHLICLYEFDGKDVGTFEGLT